MHSRKKTSLFPKPSAPPPCPNQLDQTIPYSSSLKVTKSSQKPFSIKTQTLRCRVPLRHGGISDNQEPLIRVGKRSIMGFCLLYPPLPRHILPLLPTRSYLVLQQPNEVHPDRDLKSGEEQMKRVNLSPSELDLPRPNLRGGIINLNWLLLAFLVIRKRRGKVGSLNELGVMRWMCPSIRWRPRPHPPESRMLRGGTLPECPTHLGTPTSAQRELQSSSVVPRSPRTYTQTPGPDRPPHPHRIFAQPSKRQASVQA